MQLEMTPVGEQRKYVSVILLSSQTLKCWVFSLCPSCTVCVSWAGQLGGAGESLRLGHAGPAEGPGRAGRQASRAGCGAG